MLLQAGGGRRRRRKRSRFSDAPATTTTTKTETFSSTIKAKSFIPPPLRLDANGREIDEDGNVIQIQRPVTLKANQRVRKEKIETNPYLRHVEKEKEVPFDARIKVQNKIKARKKKALQFVEQGKFTKQAQQFRNNIVKNAILRATSEAAAAKGGGPRLSFNRMGQSTFATQIIPRSVGMDANTVPLGERKKTVQDHGVVALPRRADENEDVPNMEWWDIPFLPKEKRKMKSWHHKYEDLNLEKNCKTWNLVEHPVPIDPMVKKEQPEAMKLMLTKKERKRKRRRERMAREEERREKIRLGLIDAPAPKVKMSNLMRVLKDDAVINPSLAEKLVRKEVDRRIKTHEMTNLARKLTPQERKEKRNAKIAKDADNGIVTCVFRVGSLDDKKKRFKIDANAHSWMLTGRALCVNAGDRQLVVVEGGAKSMRKFKNLMTNRLKWEKRAIPRVEDVDGSTSAADVSTPADEIDHFVNGKPNTCKLVWEGHVPHRSFKSFRFEEVASEKDARRMLDVLKVSHYWDMLG